MNKSMSRGIRNDQIFLWLSLVPQYNRNTELAITWIRFLSLEIEQSRVKTELLVTNDIWSSRIDLFSNRLNRTRGR